MSREQGAETGIDDGKVTEMAEGNEGCVSKFCYFGDTLGSTAWKLKFCRWWEDKGHEMLGILFTEEICIVTEMPGILFTEEICIVTEMPGTLFTEEICIVTEMPGTLFTEEICIVTEMPGTLFTEEICIVTEMPGTLFTEEICIVTEMPGTLFTEEICIVTEMPGTLFTEEICIVTEMQGTLFTEEICIVTLVKEKRKSSRSVKAKLRTLESIQQCVFVPTASIESTSLICWAKSRELSSVLTTPGALVCMKGKTFRVCIQSI